MQGKVRNYLGKQKMVKAPKKWKSGPDHPDTELAYITKAEKDLLLKADLHNSLSKGPNKGPSGIISLNSAGSGYGGPGPGRSEDRGGGGGNPHIDHNPKPAPARVSPGQSMAMTGNTSLAGKTQSDAQASVDRDNASRDRGTSLHGGPTYDQNKVDLTKMIRNQSLEKMDYIPDDLTQLNLNRFGETISPLDKVLSKDEKDYTIEDKRIIEEYEKTIDYDKVKKLSDRGESFQDIQKAIDKGLLMKQDAMRRQGLIDRGLAMIKPETKLESNLMDTLKKTFNPKKIATNFALRKMGLSWLNPVAGLASLFFPKQTAAVKSKFLRKPKDMSAFNQLGRYADRQSTSTNQFAKRVGQETIGSDIALGKKGVFESGQELLGLKGIEGQQAKNLGPALIQMRNFERKSKAPEIYGALTPEEEKMYEKSLERDREEKIYRMPVVTVAKGGRIDKTLTGRSRDI
jgi:hypothetical protein